MIEDGENIERNPNKEIESQGMYIYIIYILNTCTYYWNYKYIY